MSEDPPTSRRKLGRYTLGPELGAGGMGTVSFGVATGALGFARPVAIKRIHPMLARDTAVLDAVRDEARIASRVRHANVVSVLDVVDDGDSVAIVFEYIHGETLASLLRTAQARGEPLPVGIAVAVVADALHGLHAAHTATGETGAPLAIIHRDVSPQNVMVGADGIARVLDFGISKAENRASVTRDGQLKGKLRYMAPEQLGGEVTPAADTYAAGLLLWEALAARSPFDDVEHSAELVGRVLTGVSQRPSTHRDAIPTVLDMIVARALEVSPRERFSTAAEMAEALEATGLLASRSAVATYVARLSREVLAARARVVALLEGGMPAEDQAPSVVTEKASAVPVVREREREREIGGRARVLPWALMVLLGLVAAWFAVAPRREQFFPARPVDAPAAALSAAPPMAASSGVLAPPSAGSAEAPALAPAPSVVSALAPSRPPGKLKKGRAGASVDCSVPYTVDSNGDRHYRRECFE